MNDFKNKKIAVIGKGLEGVSSVKYLSGKGAIVTLLDEKDDHNYLDSLREYDLVVRSPGVKLSTLENALNKSASDGLGSKGKSPEITTQIKLFFDLSPAKIVGVTGTKGKGTTSSLIYEMLKKQGFDAYLGGNIGIPPFDFLDKLNTHSIVVLELSSFQLIDLEKSPHVAVLLMVTSEHLDWHKDLREYLEAKRNILKFQSENDFAVINKDYLPSRESDIHTNGKIYYVSKEEESSRGCFVKDGKVWLNDGELLDIINTKDILLPGAHNLENVCAAAMASYLVGVTIGNIAQVLKTFKGLEHRLELITEINGARYYDDSFSTTPETAVAAIEAFKEPEILVLGGSSKNSDFKRLGEIISQAENIKAIIGVGVEWDKIKSEIKNSKSEIYFIEGAKDMKTIVTAAYKIAAPGDVVLLTPACASFDMFKNYKVRGEQFRSEVLELKYGKSN